MGELDAFFFYDWLVGNRRQKGKSDQGLKNNLSYHLVLVLLADDIRLEKNRYRRAANSAGCSPISDGRRVAA